MGRKAAAIPALKVHKPSGQAYVNLDGKRVYLGKADLPNIQAVYARTLAEWTANGQRPTVDPQQITVMELVDRYLEFADGFYRLSNGKPSTQVNTIRLATRKLVELYGDLPAAEFGPLKLQALRQQWIDADLTRTTINSHLVGSIKRLFQWAVAQELVPPTAHTALTAVRGLQAGRSAAREPRRVGPVPLEHVDAIQPHVSRQVWGLIQIQLHTGARSGEIMKLRRIDLDTSGAIWTASLTDHKTAYRGKERCLYFGRQAQAVLREFFVGKGPTDYIFSPADAMREYQEKAHAQRKTPLSCGNVPGSNRRDEPREFGEHYTVDSYRRAIERGCYRARLQAEIEGRPIPSVWHPHQLRHTAATMIRKELGLEAAQIWLGHSNADVTQVYAEVDHARALDIAERMG